MPKLPPQFPTLVTAATQRDLDDPAFPMVVANWKERAARVRCLIPSDAKAQDRPGVIFVRQKGTEIFLRDVIDWVVRSLDPLHDTAVVCDPLVVMSPAALQVIAPKFRQLRNLGSAYMATAQAIKLDADGNGSEIEEDALRWFAGAANTWRQMFASETLPVPPTIPWRSPIWGGWMAGWCQRRLTEMRYFDVTTSKAIGSAMPAVGEYSAAGVPGFTLNPPAKRYAEIVA